VKDAWTRDNDNRFAARLKLGLAEQMEQDRQALEEGEPQRT
jgi:hypothetical protein